MASRRSKTKITFAQSGTGRASRGGGPPSAKPCPGGASGTAVPTSSNRGFTIPALSVPPKMPPLDPMLEKLKKKTIRRNPPKGEDLKKIKEIIKGINKEVVTVQEFVGLVTPYTGDNGNVLRNVMGDDLSSFRKMAKRVYDTMTQDVSDVLANEQIHITEYYTERYNIFTDKMMRTMDEIYKYIPDFNFELYYTDPDYLAKMFPIKEQGNVVDPEELEMQRRQEAFHRLQWLRSEGNRLNDENGKLKDRLKELKRQQRDEIMAAKQQEQQAEQRNNQLEDTQNQLQDQLQQLNDTLEKSLVVTEEEFRLSGDAKLAEDAAKRKVQNIRSQKRVAAKQQQQPWNVQTARSIEGEGELSAISNVSMASTGSKTGAVKKVIRPRMKKMPRRVKIPDPMEFSPERNVCPPQKQASPFHYSPPRSPPLAQKQTSPFHYSPPRSPPLETIRRENTDIVIERLPPPPAANEAPCAARRNLAPRDTWGGFR